MKIIKELKIASFISLGILSALFLFNPIKKNSLQAEESSDVAVSHLQHQIDSLLFRYEKYNYTIGLKVSSTKTDEVLYSRNADSGFVPASNLKLFSTAIAMDKLGNDFTWKTSFLTDGEINNGTLNGNLYIRTEGDPSISRHILNKEPLQVMRNWVSELSEKGIKKINGAVIVDNSAFLNNEIGKGWKSEYQNLFYSAKPSSFSVNENAFSIIVKASGRKGRSPQVSIYPAGADIVVINQAKISSQKRKNTIGIYKDPLRNRITVKGLLGRNKTVIQTLSMTDPENFALSILMTAFKLEKLSVKDGISLSDHPLVYTQAKPIYTYNSPPFSDLIQPINKKSNNYMANQLFLTLGYQLANDVKESETIIKEWMTSKNASTYNLHLDDGSGLSTHDLSTPNQFDTILLNMSKSSDFQYFYDSFPIAGVDGTLKNVMRYEPLYKNVRGKTGTINQVKSLCGYIRTKDHELLTFSILINDINVNRYRVYDFNQDILKILGNFSKELQFAQQTKKNSSSSIH